MALVSVPLPVVVLPQHNLTQAQVLTSPPVEILNLNVVPQEFTIYRKVDQARLQVQVNTKVNPGVN